MNVAFLRSRGFFADLLSAHLRDRLASHRYSDWIVGEAAPADEIDVLFAMGSVDRESIAALPRLFFLQTASAGNDGVDIDAATEHGVWVSAAPAGETGNAVSVAEFGIMLMIRASRRLNRTLASVRKRALVPNHLATSLSGKTACIVGLGAIGRAIAERLQPFGMKLVGTDERPEHAPAGVNVMPASELHRAVRDADYVVVCAPGGGDNDELIDASALAAMKDGAIVVNVSRGTLVDEEALAAALRSGRLAAVGLDVLSVEPADPENPLLAYPQALVTPHVAGQTDLMLAGTVDFLEGVIAELVAGKKPSSTLNAPRRPRRALS